MNDPTTLRAAELWHATGQAAPHERAISAGVDVTARPLSEWPAYAVQNLRDGWRPYLLPGEVAHWE